MLNGRFYRIMGRYCGGPTEEIDTAETEEEADYLEGEYVLAYGAGWHIWKETQTYQDGTLVDCG